MNKSKELKEVISKYPEHELVFMYPQEGTEHAYTMGHLTQILVDEYWVNDDRVWLKYDNEDEIKEYYSEIIADEMFSKLPITDEENEVVENKVEELIKNIEWKKCICVYINC